MKLMTVVVSVAALVMGTLISGGCGRFRGIPSHGGGKRFFIEQELVAATARAVAKDIDVSPLKGKRCALYVISMGDQGAGSIIGGRYSWDTLLRGSYESSATQTTDSSYPTLPTNTTITTFAEPGHVLGGTTNTTSTGAINAPSRTETHTGGLGGVASGGIKLSWPGALRNEAFINPKDGQFLNAVIHEALALRGVLVVPPQQADVDVYVTVDAFGTCRDRYDFLVYNLEILTAKTALSMCAFDRRNGGIVMPPRTSAFEAQYKETFIAWCGPIKESKTIYRAGDLLVDFNDLIAKSRGKLGKVARKPRKSLVPGKERTRPKKLTKPQPKPTPSRPEDLP